MLRLLETYETISEQAWERLAGESQYATWFQTPDGYRFLKESRDYDPEVVAVAEDEHILGLCVVQVSRSRNPLVQYLTRRAVINGGPLVADDLSIEAMRLLMSAVREQMQQQAIFTEVRCFHDYSRWKDAFQTAGWTYAPHLNFHIDCSDAEGMWNRLSENRQRQINRARSLGVRTEQTRNPADLDDWYRILSRLYRWHVHKPLPSRDFFRRLMERETLIVVRAPGGQIIGGLICVSLPGRALYEWYICGLDEQCRPYAPSVMATWAAMEYANQHGLPLFDVMGAGRPDVPYGVRDFKQKFGGQLVEQGRFITVAQPRLYNLGKAVYRIFF